MDPRPKWKLVLASRKFWACLTGLAFLAIQAWKPDFPLSEEAVAAMAALLASYILGVAVEDAAIRKQ